jgi:hypothetical protein
MLVSTTTVMHEAICGEVKNKKCKDQNAEDDWVGIYNLPSKARKICEGIKC